jgi:hypothetical protein
VWFQHALAWFIYADFHTQCDVETHKCDNDTHDCEFNTQKSDWFLHAECYFDTYDTNECDLHTHELNFNRYVWLYNEPTKMNVRSPKKSGLGSD